MALVHARWPTILSTPCCPLGPLPRTDYPTPEVLTWSFPVVVTTNISLPLQTHGYKPHSVPLVTWWISHDWGSLYYDFFDEMFYEILYYYFFDELYMTLMIFSGYIIYNFFKTYDLYYDFFFLKTFSTHTFYGGKKSHSIACRKFSWKRS